uniref:Putative clathrin assembly protein At4g32285 n=1 Tax=Rhizophora mucronata TaxID=61149 RepID=A0A2P2N3M5_RHIMU
MPVPNLLYQPQQQVSAMQKPLQVLHLMGMLPMHHFYLLVHLQRTKPMPICFPVHRLKIHHPSNSPNPLSPGEAVAYVVAQEALEVQASNSLVGEEP